MAAGSAEGAGGCDTGRIRPGLALALLFALAGCGGFGGEAAPEAAPAPASAAMPETPPLPDRVGDEAALRQFYANVQSDLIATGRLRLETAPADAPYGVPELVRDFERVALYNEYTDVNGEFLHQESPSILRRWTVPIRVAAMASPSTPRESAHDRGNVAAFTKRLARLSGTDMAMADDASVNFLVLFMNSSEREAFADQIRQRYPTFAPAVMNALRDTPLDTFCTTYAFFDPENPALYASVLILIRAEHPPLTKLSCVHEEMAQAMGLPNDSPEARPSLFSDSLEFALLTEHDEILLRMLYDPRLRPGMTAEEARPLLPDIARDAIAAEQRDGGAPGLAVN
ncbi:DUF2927 domain-containing protein [Amaricoccus solimangrovi]|uniref:DUF2927 domain-containing protein n=1 Tax=Amaricoccus solimangrovi TaxID=2589815 RepID=A0A501WR05_9RHOB|nr:DUF2927 domain-containing protein [Amaricoccus solimangrovi]TPE50504.1 DUF2927 domain-containing protein [Amaricoccus solimangrovi]